jgi:hypothetical protein
MMRLRSDAAGPRKGDLPSALNRSGLSLGTPRSGLTSRRGFTWTLLLVVVTFACLCPLTLALAQDDRQVEFRSVFRPGHNLTFVGLLQQTTWRINDTENISGVKEDQLTPAATVRYSFHVNLTGHLGFALGTGVSAYFHSGDLGDSVMPGNSYSFPSLAVGLVQNLSQSARITGFFEYAAVYFHRFRAYEKPRSGNTENPDATGRVATSFVPDSLAGVVVFDQFLTESLALSLTGGYRVVSTYCLGGGCGSSAFVNSIQFRQEGLFIGLGMNWSVGHVFGE